MYTHTQYYNINLFSLSSVIGVKVQMSVSLNTLPQWLNYYPYNLKRDLFLFMGNVPLLVIAQMTRPLNVDLMVTLTAMLVKETVSKLQ